MSARSPEAGDRPRHPAPGSRPVIFDYGDMAHYVRDMLAWHKESAPGFSVRRETARLRRCSPALVTQITHGKRRLTPDRVGDVAQLLQLTAEEKSYLGQWTGRLAKASTDEIEYPQPKPRRLRSEHQNHLLKDWVNVYVKDACRLKGFKPDAATVFRLLGGIAAVQRIEKSLAFLFQQGFLRRTLSGQVVENDVLVTTTDEIPDRAVRTFHQNALTIAKRGLTLFPLAKRRESALILPLNEASLAELKALLKDFYQQLLLFAETHASDDEQLYQVIINLCPIGGDSRAEKN